MIKSDFLRCIDEMLELDPGTLKGGEALAALGVWDSLSVLGFIALVNQRFGVTLAPKNISQAKTVDDLVMLLGDHISKE